MTSFLSNLLTNIEKALDAEAASPNRLDKRAPQAAESSSLSLEPVRLSLNANSAATGATTTAAGVIGASDYDLDDLDEVNISIDVDAVIAASPEKQLAEALSPPPSPSSAPAPPPSPPNNNIFTPISNSNSNSISNSATTANHNRSCKISLKLLSLSLPPQLPPLPASSTVKTIIHFSVPNSSDSSPTKTYDLDVDATTLNFPSLPLSYNHTSTSTSFPMIHLRFILNTSAAQPVVLKSHLPLDSCFTFNDEWLGGEFDVIWGGGEFGIGAVRVAVCLVDVDEDEDEDVEVDVESESDSDSEEILVTPTATKTVHFANSAPPNQSHSSHLQNQSLPLPLPLTSLRNRHHKPHSNFNSASNSTFSPPEKTKMIEVTTTNNPNNPFHLFRLHTHNSPSFCPVCNLLLLRFVRPGYRCESCLLDVCQAKLCGEEAEKRWKCGSEACGKVVREGRGGLGRKVGLFVDRGVGEEGGAEEEDFLLPLEDLTGSPLGKVVAREKPVAVVADEPVVDGKERPKIGSLRLKINRTHHLPLLALTSSKLLTTSLGVQAMTAEEILKSNFGQKLMGEGEGKWEGGEEFYVRVDVR